MPSLHLFEICLYPLACQSSILGMILAVYTIDKSIKRRFLSSQITMVPRDRRHHTATRNVKLIPLFTLLV